MKVIEQKVTTILRPTGINLAPFVINPYQGCQLGCCFCYAQFSKVAKKQKHAWGSYVKVKINALDILAKELDKIKPKSVLLGSTTECFQPVEKKYQITKQILELLNDRAIPFTIMSRSVLITDYIPLLEQGNCRVVYFTINTLPDVLTKEFNMHALLFGPGLETVSKLQARKINVVGYFCPILPFISDIKHIVNEAKGIIKKAEFEIINFQMAKQQMIYKAIEKYYPEHEKDYHKLLIGGQFFRQIIKTLEQLILQESGGSFQNFKIHMHGYEEFFINKY